MSHPSSASHYSRRFLNDEGHHGLAAVLAEVEPGDHSDSYIDFGATFQVNDCNRMITLDFGVYGSTTTPKDCEELRSSLENARAKAARLKAELDAFVGALEEGLVDVEKVLTEHERRAKKAAKKAKKNKKG